MSEAIRLQGVAYREVGGDLMVRGTLPQPWRARLDELGREWPSDQT